MKLENAIKKLTAAGATISNPRPRFWVGTFKSDVVEFIEQDGRAICIKVRSHNDHSDVTTDYSAGVFFSTMKSAIESASR